MVALTPASSVEELEALAGRGWPGLEQASLGEWLLRAGRGDSGRANSAMTTGSPGLPIDDAMASVCAFYTERGLRPRVQTLGALPGGGPLRHPLPDLARYLRDHQWVAEKPASMHTLVLASAAEAVDAARSRGGELLLSQADGPDEGWFGIETMTPERRAEMLAAPARYVTLRREGEPVAVGRLAMIDDWAGLFNLRVSPGARGQGIGRRLLGEMLAQAVIDGASFAFLQVMDNNQVARALYDDLGFMPHHSYAFWAPNA